MAMRDLGSLKEKRDHGLVIQRYISTQATDNLDKQQQLAKQIRVKEDEFNELKQSLHDREREIEQDKLCWCQLIVLIINFFVCDSEKKTSAKTPFR